jgi:hypothetical protein
MRCAESNSATENNSARKQFVGKRYERGPKTLPKCRKKMKLLSAGAYQADESTWVEFDNEECLGYKCPDPNCA